MGTHADAGKFWHTGCWQLCEAVQVLEPRYPGLGTQADDAKPTCHWQMGCLFLVLGFKHSGLDTQADGSKY